MFEAFGFCPYSVGCYLSHPVQQGEDRFEYYKDRNNIHGISNTINNDNKDSMYVISSDGGDESFSNSNYNYNNKNNNTNDSDKSSS